MRLSFRGGGYHGAPLRWVAACYKGARMVADEAGVVAELISARSLSPRVKHLVLRSVGETPFEWQAGQHVELSIPSIGSQAQPYSIASAPNAERPGEFELAVSRGGDVEELPVGLQLEVRGPRGAFLRRSTADTPTLFVANGTGVAPVRAMLQEEFKNGNSANVVLLFGCRSEMDLLWRAELEALAEEHPRFRFEPTLSRPTNGWTGRRGYVQEHLAELVATLAEPDVYVCGLTEMVTDCVGRLTSEHGITSERIVTEKY